MEKFISSIRNKYRKRQIQSEKEQWPPVRGDRLINLQLVQAGKEEGFRAGLPQHGSCDMTTTKRSPILYGNLFKSDNVKKPISKIIVEGNAGMGKTTLCTMLAEGWAEGKILTQFDCVLLLPLRDSRVSSATSLSELFKLLHSSDEIRLSVVKDLERSEGEGVLIIADGWDELGMQQLHIYLCIDYLAGEFHPCGSSSEEKLGFPPLCDSCICMHSGAISVCWQLRWLILMNHPLLAANSRLAQI